MPMRLRTSPIKGERKIQIESIEKRMRKISGLNIIIEENEEDESKIGTISCEGFRTQIEYFEISNNEVLVTEMIGFVNRYYVDYVFYRVLKEDGIDLEKKLSDWSNLKWKDLGAKRFLNFIMK